MGIVERKQRDKEKREQEILNAARSLFITKGYEKTTMLDIAEEAELSRRTLYHYFPHKEKISQKMILQAYQTLKRVFEQSLNQKADTAIESFSILKEAFIGYYRNHIDQFAITLLLDQETHLLGKPSENTVKCLTIINSLMKDIECVIERGIRDGSIQAVDDSKTTAVTLISMIQATMQKIYIRREWVQKSFSVNAESIIDTMFTLLLASLEKKRPHPEDGPPIEPL